MAIDTIGKRSSVIGRLFFGTFPPADGTIVASDRIHLVWLYSGITIASPIIPVAVAITAVEEIIFKSPLYTSIIGSSKLEIKPQFKSPFYIQVSEKSKLET